MDFSNIEITLKKVRGNDVDFSISEITSKKYVEMTWKFVEIWSSTHRRNIHVDSMCIRRGVPVGVDVNKIAMMVVFCKIHIYLKCSKTPLIFQSVNVSNINKKYAFLLLKIYELLPYLFSSF